MKSRLAVCSFVVLAVCLSVWFCSSSGARLWRSQALATGEVFRVNHSTRPSVLFDSVRQEQEVFHIYRKQQNFEYKRLSSALDINTWQEAIAVQFDPSSDPLAANTNRHRLIWDVFAPFYTCPLQERVGTPPIM